MFAKIAKAIKSLFKVLFGGNGESRPAERPQPRPDTSGENRLPQDAMELPADTVIIVTNEMDAIIMPPKPDDTKDQQDEVLAAETAVESTPEAEPESVPTPVTPPPTPSAPQPVPTPTPATQPTPSAVRPTNTPRYLWCLDNGHGRQTAGKRSPEFELNGRRVQFFEYEFNRDIVRRIIERLDREGVRYFNVVPEVEIGDFLRGRVDRANNKRSDLPKLFVSIHSNAATREGWGTARGIETWHHARSAKGRKMAGIFQKHLIEKTGFVNRRLKTTEQINLFVLRETHMPAILTENGFYDHPQEVIELMKPEVRQRIADAHVEAILEIERNGL